MVSLDFDQTNLSILLSYAGLDLLNIFFGIVLGFRESRGLVELSHLVVVVDEETFSFVNFYLFGLKAVFCQGIAVIRNLILIN